eukprot:5137564-Amphidinium_carterae.1
MNNYIALEHIFTVLQWSCRTSTLPVRYSWAIQSTRGYSSTPTTLIVGGIKEPTYHDNYDNHHNQQSKNKKSTELRTFPTEVGVRYVSKQKDNQPTHPRKGALKEQSSLQLDYAYIKSNNPADKKVHAILTGVEQQDCAWQFPQCEKDQQGTN